MIVRWTIAIAGGITIAAIVALLALALSPVAPELSAIVFGVVFLPFGITLGWLVAVAPRTMPDTARGDDSAEDSWLREASSGAATDVVAAAGIALAVLAITRVDLPAQSVLIGVIIISIASTVVRYALARHGALRA